MKGKAFMSLDGEAAVLSREDDVLVIKFIQRGAVDDKPYAILRVRGHESLQVLTRLKELGA